ncbi:trypsin-like serine protease with C-terminal PDZ domain [Synechococcus sp. PCC 7502]|uniref:S1C family serine protease n=1 Tax=Synechococcus sp. PCC 7502 TaxID=1173263 RepID=UPI00029FADCB|nr:trypsin-like peptidase domain-containing protein [Synechococcus sp. PCC 7502]AFY72549.1 trypsin-like serine protease with C-terminal PDZ domain [Synechococcus sp. PCC 7502]
MTRGLVSLLASSLIITGAVGITPATYAQTTTNDEDITVRVYQIASPAVVSIRAGGATGSGSIIDSKGIVLTNGHVVRNSDAVVVTLANKQKLQGRVISRSRNPDLALIQLQNVPPNLPKLNIASSSPVKVGQRAFAIGDPFGQFAGTLTMGIISRIDSDRQLLQTDAAINPGNSGGPLLNSRGELIGVNTLIFTPGEGNVGLGFAINANTVRQFVSTAPRGQVNENVAFNNPNGNPNGQERGNNLFNLDGNLKTFVLTPNDPRASDGSAYKTFRFSGRAGQKLSVEMTSRDLNPYLALVDPRGRRIAVDDNEGTARIRVVLPVSGTYTLFANSSDPGDYGRFTLSAKLGASTISNNPQNNAGVILQLRGTLGLNSNVLPRDGSLYETFSFMGRAGQRIQVELSSLDFRPYVALVSPDLQIIKENDRSEQNSAITVQLTSTGTYRVIANASDKSGRGSYTLIVRSLN